MERNISEYLAFLAAFVLVFHFVERQRAGNFYRIWSRRGPPRLFESVEFLRSLLRQLDILELRPHADAAQDGLGQAPGKERAAGQPSDTQIPGHDHQRADCDH